MPSFQALRPATPSRGRDRGHPGYQFGLGGPTHRLERMVESIDTNAHSGVTGWWWMLPPLEELA